MFRKITRWFSWIFHFRAIKCHIVHIDAVSQEVVFHIVSRATFLKYSISEAVADSSVVDHLPPMEACWLGGYYGRALRASHEGRDAMRKVKGMTFLLNSKQGRYTIAFQNRNGDIGYFDKKTRQEFIEHPLTIVNNNHVILGFCPSQACYIGMLAGLQLEKALVSSKDYAAVDFLLNKPPKLRIVQ